MISVITNIDGIYLILTMWHALYFSSMYFFSRLHEKNFTRELILKTYSSLKSAKLPLSLGYPTPHPLQPWKTHPS